MKYRLPLLLVLIAGLVVCAVGQARSLEPRSAAPADIGGYWFVQRLGTPDNGFFFVDADHGWGLASQVRNAIFRTTDGGANWQASALGHSDDPFRVNDVFFVTPEEGWATGRRDMADIFWNGVFIVHTTDGGDTWTDQIGMGGQHTASSPGQKVWFVDAQRGWVQQGSSYLWRTTDGGQNWTRLEPSGMPERLLRFINPTTGFGILTPPWSGPELMRTGDGGETWYGIGLVPDWANALWVDDGGVIIFAVGTEGKIGRSPNAGVTWTPIASPTTNTLSHVTFVDSLNGWAAGEVGTVLRTTDGGWNWTLQDPGTTQSITSLAVADGRQAWVYADRLRRTRDGGAHWSPLRQVSTLPLRSIGMGSALVGWAGGADPYLLATADGGRLWTDQVGVAGGVVEAVDAQRAWVLSFCESSPCIQRTTDGGAHWVALAAPSGSPTDLDFANANRGWLTGGSTIYATADGGLTWTAQYTDTTSTMSRVSFVSSTQGWVMARGENYIRRILGTSDGGAHWTEITTIARLSWKNDRDIDFADANRGWLIDDIAFPGPEPAPSYIGRTTDGGAMWQQVGPTAWYHAIDFADAQEGWVVGDYGLILHTTDGGVTWTAMEHPTRLTLRGVHAVEPGLAWIVGDGGLILHYSASQPPGCWATPTPHPVSTGTPPPVATVDRQVAHCFDDAYVRVDTGELLYDTGFVRMGGREGGVVPYVAAFLFRDVRIPQGAQITSARVQLQPWGYQSGAPIIVQISGDARGRSEDFNPLNWPAQTRPRTVAAIPWTLTGIVSGTTDSPDISAVVQEIVGLGDWQPGNDLALFMDPTGGSQQFVDWDAYDYRPTLAARLIASYEWLATSIPTSTPTPSATKTPTVTLTPAPTRTSTPTRSMPIWLPLLMKTR